MTRHLIPDEVFAAADGGLEPARLEHLVACDRCRAAVDDARAFLARLSAVEVPEPSPLFWDHFSARVKSATRAEPVAGPLAWWDRWLRPAVVASATLSMVLLAVWLVRQPVLDVVPAEPTSDDVTVAGGPDSWDSVVALTSEWSLDEVEGLTAAGEDDGSTFVDELSGAERVALAQILREELAVLP
jgi:hypothetical protein